VAAGVVLIREAGGEITRFDGSTFDVFSPELLAGASGLLPAMQQVLRRGKRPDPSPAAPGQD